MKVLLDTDIGSDIDDALALLLLLRLPDAELVGVTTVYGKVNLRARIARRILSLAGRQVPVAAGIGFPLRPAFPVWHTGMEGVGLLDESELSERVPNESPTDVASFIVDRITARPKEVTIIAIGPLTNIAMALDAKPRLPDYVNEIVFMGAGVTYPHDLPSKLAWDEPYYAERSHNVGCDVEAARRVFSSRLRIRVLTNDVTRRVWWGGPSFQQLIDAKAPLESVAVGRLMRAWLKYRTGVFGP